VLLDLVLPAGDGLGVLEKIRGARPGLPVIVLTARGGEDDGCGGCDWVPTTTSSNPSASASCWPGRLRFAALAREDGRHRHLPLPGGEIDLQRLEVRFTDGTATSLSPLEADLLRYLAGNAHRATSREELLQWIWKVNPRRVQTRSVDMAVARLRSKLRDDGEPPRVLLTVRGKATGWRMTREPSPWFSFSPPAPPCSPAR